jgi:hypothetical protein
VGRPAIDEARRADDQRLRDQGARIEELLEHLSGQVGPSAWPRVEELVARLVQLYGAGLERVLSLTREAGAMSPELASRLRTDELVASLLLVHDLDPAGGAARDQRIDVPLERLRARREADS